MNWRRVRHVTRSLLDSGDVKSRIRKPYRFASPFLIQPPNNQERPSTRGGVPVFIRPDSKPAATKSSVIPYAALSPTLPPPNCFFSNMNQSTFRKVPLVNTTALERISTPSEVRIPFTFPFSNNQTFYHFLIKIKIWDPSSIILHSSAKNIRSL